ncbi:MAG: polyamine aminopropyltransferase [Deltaproteobacteria bacterium]|nr:polyamine aminopropyltransferase [Deltaproteobacteria bacterium]
MSLPPELSVEEEGHPPSPSARPEARVPGVGATAVLLAVFVIAICGLIYELIAGAVASYVLGDSVTQFSIVIGVYLSAMGLGAWLSRFLERALLERFIELEAILALVGGASSTLLFLSFSRLSFFRVVLYALVGLIGTLVGLEIPILMRILKDRYELKELVSRVLTFDYLGALVASVAFPLFIVPELGLIRGALAVGTLNALVAAWLAFAFGGALLHPGRALRLRLFSVGSVLVLLLGLVFADRFTGLAEEDLYAEPIVFAKSSPYQRVVITRGRASFQLYLDGNLQFSSADEHRYHEALVHPVMAVASSSAGTSRPVRRVLILGGGDGLALREVWKHPGVQAVTMVDLDPLMTELARTHALLAAANRDAMADPRLTVVNEDAMIWLGDPRRGGERFDAVIIDFPDPNNFSLGKLYTTHFYRLVARVLAPEGALVVQATSPLLARQSFWCVVETIEAAGFVARPYHANVPAFGEWGYVLAAARAFAVPGELPEAELSYLTPEVMAGLFVFPPDMARVPAEVNRLYNQILVQYYEREWSRW